MRVCPFDWKPCCDDLCHGGGCIMSSGDQMIELCDRCGKPCDGPDYVDLTCRCDDPDNPYWEEEEPDACEPRFKIGDRVRVRKNRKAVGTVEHVTEWCPGGSIYKVRYGKRTCRCYYEDEIEPAPEEAQKP